MLTKAILTGGVLSLLAGSAVYFSTEGADAQETNTPEVPRVDDTALAGAVEATEVAIDDVVVNEQSYDDIAVEAEKVAEVDVQHPPQDTPQPQETSKLQETSKPKTKWLDQYLKKTKPQAKADESVEADVEVDLVSEPEGETVTVTAVETVTETTVDMAEEDGETELEMALKEISPLEKMATEDMATEDMTTEDMVEETSAGDLDKRAADHMGLAERVRLSKERRQAALDKAEAIRTAAERVRLGRLDAKTSDIEDDIDIEGLKRELGIESDKNIEVRIIRKTMDDGVSWSDSEPKAKTPTDYAPILAEAKKLLVIDMRNQAFLEIIDHAIDQDDFGQAADIVEELSTPELRDTARARIGTGLARRNDGRAAFAVLKELEIDELAAPIRLEIITALMETDDERNNFGYQR